MCRNITFKRLERRVNGLLLFRVNVLKVILTVRVLDMRGRAVRCFIHSSILESKCWNIEKRVLEDDFFYLLWSVNVFSLCERVSNQPQYGPRV